MSDAIGEWYRSREEDLKNARQKLAELKASGASAEEIREQEKWVDQVAYLGD